MDTQLLVFVAQPAVCQFSAAKLLNTRCGTWLHQRGFLYAILIVIAIMHLVLPIADFWIPGTTLTLTYTDADGEERQGETRMKSFGLAMLASFLRVLACFLLAHLSSKEMWCMQLLTFDALFIVFNIITMRASTGLFLYILVDCELSGHTWIVQQAIEDITWMPVAAVVATLDSVMLPPKVKVALLSVMAAGWCLMILKLESPRHPLAGDDADCFFGLPCSEFRRLHKSALINLTIFMMKATFAHLTGKVVATIKPSFRPGSVQDVVNTDCVDIFQNAQKLTELGKVASEAVAGAESCDLSASAASTAFQLNLSISPRSDSAPEGPAAPASPPPESVLASESPSAPEAVAGPVVVGRPGNHDNEKGGSIAVTVASLEVEVVSLKDSLREANERADAMAAAARSYRNRYHQCRVSKEEAEVRLRRMANIIDDMAVRTWQSAFTADSDKAP